jgi:hypothetical protein
MKKIFSLSDPDSCLGPLFLAEDIASLMNISVYALNSFFKLVDGKKVIAEDFAYKLWYDKTYNKKGFMVNGRKTSLDEEILNRLLESHLNEYTIIRQKKISSYSIDFSLEKENKVLNIEFLGPGHFMVSRFGIPTDPLYRKKQIEDKSGEEVVLWPYWIPRNFINIKSILDGTKGIGALYSCKSHFSHFSFRNSADVIVEISRKFNCLESGIGVFYESMQFPEKDEHPIISDILSGKKPVDILIPQGANNPSFWVPDSLSHLIKNNL